MAVSVSHGSRGCGNAALWAVPDEVVFEVIRFDPDSVLKWRAVSRALKKVGDDFLQWSAGEIFALRFQMVPSLSWLVGNHFVQCDRRPGAHLSLSREIRTLGVSEVDCPDRRLSPQDVVGYNDRVQTMQDTHLQRIWERVRQRIVERGLLPGREVPEVGSTAQQLRSWMEARQTVVQSLASLNFARMELTCVPVEMGLFTRLQSLSLGNSRLTSLPGGLFNGMVELKALWLDGNLLTFLPGDLFQGLSGLEELDLANNQLSSLPRGLFDGMVGLRRFWLNGNEVLTSLPRGIFDGLVRLQWLYLWGNTGLSVSFKEWPEYENHISFLPMMEAFFNYHCVSPFAQFYQFAGGGHSPEAVREAFSRLDGEIKRPIVKSVREEAGCPEMGEEHPLFNTMPIFRRALKNCVLDRFYSLTYEQKNAVYDRVSVLAQSGRGGQDLDCRAPGWRTDHILRLIDAMGPEGELPPA